MTAYSESTFIGKLDKLNASSQSIQILSLWLIHHRKHSSDITASWYNEMCKAPNSKKLLFMYLANDVIQNSKKKGPEYREEFQKVLQNAFLHIGETQPDNKTIHCLNRILNVWEDRMVYDTKLLQGFREALHKHDDSYSPKTGPPEKRRRHDDDAKRHKISKQDGWGCEWERVKSETVKVNGTVETHVSLSAQWNAADRPEPEELIRALTELKNSASRDSVVREQIANLPPEVSEVAMLSKLGDKERAEKLAAQADKAAETLHDYKNRLCAEIEDRKKLMTMLKDFEAKQQDLLAQAEQRLQEHNDKLIKVEDVQREIQTHLQHLPDLTQLPDVIGGLAPLPSAEDLFSIHCFTSSPFTDDV